MSVDNPQQPILTSWLCRRGSGAIAAHRHPQAAARIFQRWRLPAPQAPTLSTSRSEGTLGHVPNHGPYCRKLRSYPTACPSCGARVVYFECSCGSKVFLSPTQGQSHDCRSTPPQMTAKQRRRHRAGTTPLISKHCPYCFAGVASDRYKTHVAACSRRRPEGR